MRTSDALTSQLELLLPWDSSSGARIATASHRAATPSANSTSGRLDPLGSPLLALTALRLARSHLTARARKTGQLAVTRMLMQGRPSGLQLPRCWCKEDQPVHSRPAANTRKTDEPTRCSWSFAGIHRARPTLELTSPVTTHTASLLVCMLFFKQQ